MKRLFLISFYLILFTAANAQMARWLIQPLYDNISIADGVDAIVTDSAGYKTVWTFSGKKLITTNDKLYPFKEGVAVSVDLQNSSIKNIYDIKGNKTSVQNYEIAHGYPYFSCGMLLVKDGRYYKYLDKEGNALDKLFVQAFPYSNGYATCSSYLNWEKQKNLCHYLLDNDGDKIKFSYDDKDIDEEDIQYISSINDENIGFVVVKNKVFSFNGKVKKIAPLLYVEGGEKQAKVEDDFFKRGENGSYYIIAKCGKNEIIRINFNSFFVPTSIIRGLNEYVYSKNEMEVKYFTSLLRGVKHENNKYAIYNHEEELIPAQFDDVNTCFGNNVLVKKDGKYGMIEVFKNARFDFKMNKGDDIAFRHQKFETILRVDFPNIISSNLTEIQIDTETGCELDPTSKKNKDTDNGNFIQYNCILSIPDSLPDKLTEIKYPIQISHDGIKYKDELLKVNAWYYKYFVVDIDDTQTLLEKNNVSFVFNINAERIANEGVYPTKVEISTDSLLFDIDKISEIRYKCKVLGLNEGVNNIVVTVLEKGCPPAIFPFEIEYYKPVARTRNRPAVKEKVIIKKKEVREPFVIMD